MLNIWAAKSRPLRSQPDRRGDRRDLRDAARSFIAFLAEREALDAAGHERALAALDLPGRRTLPVLLVELGLIHEATLVTALSEATGLPILDPGEVSAAPVLPEAIGADYCARARVLPVAAAGDCLTVAVVDPFDPEIAPALEHLADRTVERCLIGPGHFELAHRAVYGDAAPEEDGPVDDDLARLQDVASQAPIVRLAARLVRKAFELSASDIHLEAEEADMRVRYRVDGVLVEAERLAKSVQLALTTRIKIQAGLNIAERRLPQDGRMKAPDRGQDVDIRVSTLPTAHGESVVLRVLDGSRRVDDFSGLGFDAPAIARIEAMTARPNGLVLVTGPTGSGKTVAFALRLLRRLSASKGDIQAVVLAPSRELVIQIADVIRPVAAGLKTVAFYGGHAMADEENSLKVTPDIIVATPGRLLDHIRRGNLSGTGSAPW